MGTKPIFCIHCSQLRLVATGHKNFECPLNLKMKMGYGMGYGYKGNPVYQRAKKALKKLKGYSP